MPEGALNPFLKLDPVTVAVGGSGLAALTAAVYVGNKIRENHKESRRIQETIDTRRCERDESFKELKAKYILDDKAYTITNLSVEALIEKLQTRNLTSVEVLQAFIAKAVNVTDNYNCITEFVPNALERAQELDKLGSVKGPLHGMPVCIKDDHDIQGMDTTLGLGKNLNKPAEKNSILVQTLIDLGAVPFCKTNIPQTLFSYSSDNPIYGETVNNRDRKLAPGGSSCGTACLISAGGAPFGTGTDIAGSVRIPAHFSNLCTLLPTQNRLSSKGIVSALPKCVGLKGVPGILAADAKTVSYVFRALTINNMQNTHDPKAAPIPWNDEVFKSEKPLRIGYYTSLSFFPAIGDTMETVLSAKKALESKGHTVVPFEIENDWNIMKLMNDVFCIDFGCHSALKELFANEPNAKGLEGLRSICGQPDWVRRVTQYFNPVTWPCSSSYSARTTMLCRGGLDQSTDLDVWDLMSQRDKLISTILSDMSKFNLDLILAPTFPFPACRLEDAGPLFGAVLYTMLWNFVDFPAGVVPYGVESGTRIDEYDDEGDSLLRLAKESTKESVGTPISVQLIGKPFNEELVLRTMVQLQSTERPLAVNNNYYQ